MSSYFLSMSRIRFPEPLRKNGVILDLKDDICDFFRLLFPDDFISCCPDFLKPIKNLSLNIEENSRNSPDIWKNMKTVALLQKLQKDMYEYFEKYLGDDYIQDVKCQKQLDVLSARLTVVYTDMMNDLNHKAHSRLSNLLFQLISFSSSVDDKMLFPRLKSSGQVDRDLHALLLQLQTGYM